MKLAIIAFADHVSYREFDMNMLVLNAGSSSLKFCGYRCLPAGMDGGSSFRCVTGKIYRGHITNIKLECESLCDFKVEVNEETIVESGVSCDGMHGASVHVVNWVRQYHDSHTEFRLAAVVHRVVFGGDKHMSPSIINESLMSSLEGMCKYAPEHLPASLAVMDVAISTLLPDSSKGCGIVHVACFDTGFFADLPALSQTLPIPRSMSLTASSGDDSEPIAVRRYGFHGLSYASLLSRLRREYKDTFNGMRVVLAHLGHGASVCAVMNGHVVETSMGFSPTGGIPMCSRSGDLDPAVVMAMLEGLMSRQENRIKGIGEVLAQLNRVLTHESGLKALSEHGDNMKTLLQLASQDDTSSNSNNSSSRSSAVTEIQQARFAADYFVYHLAKCICAHVCAAGGIDLLVLTAGIGVHCPRIRSLLGKRLAHLGIILDEELNSSVADAETANVIVHSCDDRQDGDGISCRCLSGRISSAASSAVVRVMETDEEGEMAQQVFLLLSDRK